MMRTPESKIKQAILHPVHEIREMARRGRAISLSASCTENAVAAWRVFRHACSAGKGTHSTMTRNDLIVSIRKTANALCTIRLSAQAFRRQTGVTMSAIYRHFDSWSDACLAAGVNHGPTEENLLVPPSFSREECVAEMKRVAALLGQHQLSSKEFSRHAKFTAKPVIKRFGR